MTLTLSSARDLLARMNACDESSRWLAVLPSDTTPESAWSTCPRGDWLVWLLGRLHRAGVLSRQTLTLAGCAAARTSLVHLAGTPWHAPSLAAIETTERWCRGEATPEEVRKARHAAWEARNADAALPSVVWWRGFRSPELDALIAEAHENAARIISDAETTANEQITAYNLQIADLETKVTELRAFETEYRRHLRTYIEGQLKDLDKSTTPAS